MSIQEAHDFGEELYLTGGDLLSIPDYFTCVERQVCEDSYAAIASAHESNLSRLDDDLNDELDPLDDLGRDELDFNS